MKIKLVIFVLSICVYAGGAQAEDLDIQAIIGRLERQDARIRDIEAKNAFMAEGGYGEAVPGMTSLPKNAVVTLGVLVTTGYYFGDVSHSEPDFGSMNLRKARSHKDGSLTVSDAELHFNIQVSEHFDAFLKLDLHNAYDDEYYGMAEAYWVRWKNVADTGLGVKVGRDELVLGTERHGYLDGWMEGQGDGMGAFGVWFSQHRGNAR